MRTSSRAISSGDSTKSMHPLAIALSGISGWIAVLSFCAMVNAAYLFNTAQRRGSVAVIAGDNHSNQLAVPVTGQ